MDTIAGLPAHPLLVHFPIVAIPLAAVLLVIFVLVPSWRSMLNYLILALGGAIAIGSLLAASSGESLEERVDETAAVKTHADLGGQMEIIGVLFGLTLVALGLYGLLSRRGTLRLNDRLARTAMTGLMAATVVVGSVAVVWVVRTGHTGAKASWSETTGTEHPDNERGGDDDAMLQSAAFSHFRST